MIERVSVIIYLAALESVRELKKLTSVGKAALTDFENLGITTLEQLIGKNAVELLQRLEKIRGAKLDPCCVDLFRCAIELAQSPGLSEEKRQCFCWSKICKKKSR